MTIEAVVMKHLSIVLIVLTIGANGYNILPLGSSDTPTCNGSPIATCPCQEGFIKLASGKCYFISFKKESWRAALAVCESVGATLAYPVNHIEDTVLATHLKANFNELSGWWLGGMDLTKQGHWVWVHNNASITHFDWSPGEPTAFVRNWHCLQYYSSSWQWSNANCNSPLPFVCQQL